MQNFIKNYFCTKNIIIAFSFISILCSLNSLFKIVNAAVTTQRHVTFVAPGHTFEGIKDRVAGLKKIGFLTDKDMSSERNDGEFLQAQYALAPTILELNNKNHSIFLLDCTSMTAALNITKGMGVQATYINPYGKILAIKQP